MVTNKFSVSWIHDYAITSQLSNLKTHITQTHKTKYYCCSFKGNEKQHEAILEETQVVESY